MGCTDDVYISCTENVNIQQYKEAYLTKCFSLMANQWLVNYTFDGKETHRS